MMWSWSAAHGFADSLVVSAAAVPGDAGPDATTYAMAAGCLGLGLAILGAGLGQGRAAAAAYDGICRNPSAAEKVFSPLIIGMALLESLVILAFITNFFVFDAVT